jgi:cytochrome c oxidase assembly protein subunit 11
MMRFDKNARIAWTLVAVLGGMLGMAYAAVPLYYELFCKATGFGGTPIVVQEGERPVLSCTVTVGFAETLRGSLRGSR